MDNIVAVIQARMGSERLPGKTLADVTGKPLLQRVIERLSRAKKLSEIVVATTPHPRDEPIITLAKTLGVRAITGSEEDVLARYLLAAQEAHADILMRVTGDCPLIDPGLADAVVEAFYSHDVDYVTNREAAGFPRGMDAEVFSMESFEMVSREATQPYEREHVTPYYYRHPERFRIFQLDATGALRRPDLRLCVDTEADLSLVRTIYERLEDQGNPFSLIDVIHLFDQDPALALINADVVQKPLPGQEPPRT